MPIINPNRVGTATVQPTSPNVPRYDQMLTPPPRRARWRRIDLRRTISSSAPAAAGRAGSSPICSPGRRRWRSRVGSSSLIGIRLDQPTDDVALDPGDGSAGTLFVLVEVEDRLAQFLLQRLHVGALDGLIGGDLHVPAALHQRPPVDGEQVLA